MTPVVLHVAQPTDAGVARCVADLAAHQVAKGWAVTVACPSAGPLRNWVRQSGALHMPWEAERAPSFDTVKEARGVSTAVRAQWPDVVHLHSSKAGLAGRLALRGRRVTIFQPHAWSFEALEGALRRASIMWERLAARWADVIMCVSEAEREIGLRMKIAARYRVVPNGVDLSLWAMAYPEEKRSARRKLGIPDDPLVVNVGRLCPQKGQDLLLDAWPSVLAVVPHAQLVLVGDGPDEPALRRRAVPRVRMVGPRSDVADWLAAADVFALPSRWEGMPLVLLEAMARGRSVVATDVAGVRECLGDRSGSIVAPHDPQQLGRKLVERLEHSSIAEAEGRAGRRRVEHAHDLFRNLALVDDVYEEAMAHPSVRGGSGPSGLANNGPR